MPTDDYPWAFLFPAKYRTTENEILPQGLRKNASPTPQSFDIFLTKLLPLDGVQNAATLIYQFGETT